jgi:hypothetical protein
MRSSGPKYYRAVITTDSTRNQPEGLSYGQIAALFKQKRGTIAGICQFRNRIFE